MKHSTDECGECDESRVIAGNLQTIKDTVDRCLTYVFAFFR